MVKPGNSTGKEGGIQTNWCVLTGAPCSGKTAVVNELARRGHGVVHEAARAHIEGKQARGFSLDRIRGDEVAFEHLILEKKVAIETLLVECYRDLGYSIIRIPVFTVFKRADLILQHLQ